MAIHHTDVTYHDYIRDYLVQRAHSVRIDANLNLLNLAVYSENFYVEFLNELFDLQLENANASKRNKPGIDLIDWKNRVAAQVSVTCAPQTIREKIRNSIQKFDKPEGDWQFYFVPITDKAPDLQKDFELPDGLKFKKDRDVLDITRIMELVDSKVSAKKRVLSALVDRYSKDETDYLELRKRLDDLLLLTWEAHRSYKLMLTDEIDRRLFPNIQNAAQFEALGKRKDEDAESPVWSIIRESWNEKTNHPVMIQGKGGIGKTVTLFSLTNLDKALIPAPAVYVPMFELVNQEGEVVNLTDYFQSVDVFPSLTTKQRENLSELAARPWDRGPSLLVLLDGFNEVPGKQRWNVLQMLRTWHGKNQGAQIIAVSRPMDNLSLETAFGKETISVTLSELTKESVTAYLSSPQGEGVRIPEPNAPIWETIVYPLFLNLYIKADRLRNQQAWKEYPLDIREAAGPGSIIWNYLQRELLRQEDDGWILRCALACEYFAPILAHHMLDSYDYTISQRDALALIQKAASEMNLNQMPNHIADLISRWETQELSMEPPLYLKEQNWPDILLRESGLLTPYQENKTEENGIKQEPRFEFLHQSFRDCLAGIYLLNQAETVGENKLPVIWGQLQNDLALNYAAELIDPKLLDQLWEANRIATQHEDSVVKKNHIATCNLLEMYRRNVDLQKDLDFCGMDLRGLSLTQYLGKSDSVMPLFRDRKQTIGTYLDRATFESQGHIDTISTLTVLPDGRAVSASYDNTIQIWNVYTGQRLQTLVGHRGRVTCIVVHSNSIIVSGSDDHTLRVWDTITGQCMRTLKGHSEIITCLAVLTNGYVVSGSHGTLRLWDINANTCLRVFRGHTDWISCVTALSDNRFVSGSYDNTLRVWDSGSDECLRTLKGHVGRLSCVTAFSDGRIVSGSQDNTIRVWNAKSSHSIQVLDGHRAKISCLTTFKGNYVISGSFDRTIRVWDVKTGREINTLSGHTREILCLDIFPDGRVVSGAKDTTLRVWDISTGRCLQTFETRRASVTSVAVLRNGHVVSGSKDNTLRVWDSTTGECLQSLEGHRGAVSCISVLENGRVVCGSYDHTLRVWDISAGKCIQTLRGHKSGVFCVAVLQDGKIVSGSYDHTLRIWSDRTGNCLKTLEGHHGTVYCVAVLPNGRIISGSHDTTLRVWDPTTGHCLKTLEGHSKLINCILVLPDGRAVSASDDNTLRVWDTDSGQCLKVLNGHTDWVRCIAALSHNHIISGSKDKTLRVWDITTGNPTHILEKHRRGIYCVSSLPDGRVISGSSDSTLRIWDATKGLWIMNIGSHGSTVYCMTVLSNGRVVSGSYDTTLKVWDVFTGKHLRTLKGHTGRVFCVAELPDGRIVSGSYDGTLRVWNVDTGDCLDVLEGMEVQVSSNPGFQMDFSDAVLTKDLACLLWHNGAEISSEDYDCLVKPYRSEPSL